MKHVPNIITLSRVLLSLTLLLLYDRPWLFFMVYLIAGMSDMLDGYLARVYDVQSTLGATLDTIADLCLFLVCLIVLFLKAVNFPTWLILSVILIGLIRVVNAAITKMRFQRFSIMHTNFNKITGFLLWSGFPVVVFNNNLTPVISAILVIIALISSIEEFVIVSTASRYDANQRHWTPRSK